MGKTRKALEYIAELNDAKIEEASPDILLCLLQLKVGRAREALNAPDEAQELRDALRYVLFNAEQNPPSAPGGWYEVGTVPPAWVEKARTLLSRGGGQ